MASKKKGGSAPKAPVDNTAHYAQLVKLQNTQNFDKALKVCNKILNTAPADTKAFHCKMVCLLQLDRFDAVVQQIEDNEHLKADVDFEKSYALYRLNRSKEALDVLEKRDAKLDIKHMELKAQVLYRLERYQECFDLYRHIMKNTSDDFEMERLTNFSAVALHASDGKKQKAVSVDDEDSYELCYNKTCHLLAHGKYQEAEKMLNKSIELCAEMLKEEFDDPDSEDVERETGILRVQLGFALQMQGREREAQAIYNQVLRAKPSDIGVVAVASNNLVAINRDQNIFDSKKRIKAATVDGLESKLPKATRLTIARNNALLAMYTNQVDLCRNLVKEMADRFHVVVEDADFIEAGVLSRAGKTTEAVQKLLAGGKETDLERVMVAAQIYLEKKMVKEALSLFEHLPDEDKFRPGILSAMMTLFLYNEDRQGAAQLLKAAVSSKKVSQKTSRGQSDAMSLIWRKTAEFHLKGDEPEVAAESLEALLRTKPNDRQTLAQLVLAYAKFDLSKAMEASKKLPEFGHSSVDVDALESSAFLSAKYAKKGGKVTASSPKAGTADDASAESGALLAKRKTKKKHRKKRLPKDYNPDVDPDPERWLPRRERTGYRRTRKDRRKGEKFTGAQGTAVGASENYDYSQKSSGAVPKQPHKSPAVEAPVGPRQQHKKPQQKKKTKNKNRF